MQVNVFKIRKEICFIKIFLTIYIFLQFQSNLTACEKLFAEHDEVEFKAYVENLLREDVLTIRHLINAKTNSDKGIQTNLISVEESSGHPLLILHRDGLQKFIDGGVLKSPRVVAWLENRIQELVSEQDQRKDFAVKTLIPISGATFHRIEPGYFYAYRKQADGKQDKLEKFSVTRPFEIMNEPVSREQWQNIFGTGILPDPDFSKAPDHPRGNVSWWSAVLYANSISSQKDLKPVYQISQNQLFGNRPGDGDYRMIGDSLTINAPNGNIYEAEGYRLPTLAEMHLIKFRQAYQLKQTQLWLNQDEFKKLSLSAINYVLDNYAFPVATEEFLEWTNDAHPLLESSDLADPLGQNSFVIHIKQVFRTYGIANQNTNERGYHDGDRFRMLGFRLVRTLGPSESPPPEVVQTHKRRRFWPF